MGLAASQARLLTITARLADNELRSQTINNAKMRLATQSAQASEKYVNALNESNMMFQNTMMDGTYQNQLLTFNALTAFSPYNTQYGLANSAGLALVSEADANMFEYANGSVEKFLNMHGIEWGTTYFDHVNAAELEAAMGSDYGVVFKSITGYNAAADKNEFILEYLKNAYEHYDAYESSLEYATYMDASASFLAELRNSATRYETWILGTKEDTNGARLSTAAIINNLLAGFVWDASNEKYYQDVKTKGEASDASEADKKRWALLRNTFETYNPDTGMYEPTEYSWTDYSKNLFAYILQNLSDEFIQYWHDEDLASVYTNILKLNDLNVTQNGEYYYVDGDSDPVWNIADTSGMTPPIPEDTGLVYALSENDKITFTKSGSNWVASISGDIFQQDDDDRIFIEDAEAGTIEYFEIDQVNDQLVSTVGYKNRTEADKDALHKMLYGLIDCPTVYMSWNARSDSSMIPLLNVIFGEDPTDTNAPWTNINKFAKLLGISLDRMEDPQSSNLSTFLTSMRQLTDIGELLHRLYNDDGTLRSTEAEPSAEFQNLIDMYRVECMVSVYGEPKYSWIDKNDTGNTGNADSKAQWLTNLFERMKKGYRVLEDGLASSNEWIEYALQSGLVTVEQVDSSNNWVNIDYKTCAGITEQTDRSALVAKAEAEYNRAMNDIKQKDSIYDLQLKNIDTEHSSLQQEYESIQKVINKNIERTMKFDQNG